MTNLRKFYKFEKFRKFWINYEKITFLTKMEKLKNKIKNSAKIKPIFQNFLLFSREKNIFLDDFSNPLDLFRSENSISCMFKVREVAYIGRGHFLIVCAQEFQKIQFITVKLSVENGLIS